MMVRHIYLYGWDWEIIAFYDVVPSDADAVLMALKRYDCPHHLMRRATRNLMAGKLNNGLTYTNNARRASVMVIGRTSDAAQFWNTLDHEKGHLAEHIAQKIHLDPEGEEIEYLRGLIAEKVYPEAIQFLCSGCTTRQGDS